jgi:hypothetical protein
MSAYDPPRIDVEEKTEIIYGDENIIRDTLEVYSVLTNSIDICNDSNGPSMFVIPNHPVTKVYRELRERGIRLRFIAEVTKDNIVYSKELMKNCDFAIWMKSKLILEFPMGYIIGLVPKQDGHLLHHYLYAVH